MAGNIRSDLSIVKIWNSDAKKWAEIECGKPKVGRKQNTNERRACNSNKPYEININEASYSIELPEINIKHYNYFNWVMDRQESRAPLSISIVIFRYDAKGAVVRDHYLKGVIFESMDQEGNDAFDMKGSAVSHEK